MAKRKKKRTVKPHPASLWKRMQEAYETREDCPSYRDLEKEFGVTLPSIVAHSKKEGWIAGRKRHFNRVLTETKRKAEKQQVKQEVDWLQRHRELRSAMYVMLMPIVKKDAKGRVVNVEFKIPVKSYEGFLDKYLRLCTEINIAEGKPSERIELTGDSLQKWSTFITRLRVKTPELAAEFLELVGYDDDSGGG